MNPSLKNVLAVILGIVIGGIVNMGLINLGGIVIPPPAGAEVSDVESLAQSMHLFEAKHFIFPFLAHAVGTLVGAIIAFKVAANNNLKMSLVVGGVFLIGGTMMVFSLPAPLWFDALDLIVAYLPMGWLGAKIGSKL